MKYTLPELNNKRKHSENINISFLSELFLLKVFNEKDKVRSE